MSANGAMPPRVSTRRLTTGLGRWLAFRASGLTLSETLLALRSLVLRILVIISIAVAAFDANASGPIPFEGRVEGTSETLTGRLELKAEGWPADQFRFRSNAGIDCVGPMIQKAGVLHEAILQCSDGQSGLISLRIFGENPVTEATLGGRKLILSMPNHPRHRSR